jgi:hypothetical protein
VLPVVYGEAGSEPAAASPNEVAGPAAAEVSHV